MVLASPAAVYGAPVRLFDEAPTKIVEVTPGLILVDFGRVAFGNLRLLPPAKRTSNLTVHFGEALVNGRINRKPPGTVRYARTTALLKGTKPMLVAPPADKRNTEHSSTRHPPAVLTPREWGVVLPFRWVEIEGWPGKPKSEQIVRQSAFAATWDDNAVSFHSSDRMLNRIWELCRYSIKATTFAGIYVDGDRERIPYEGDAYLNQLSHYAMDNDFQMARDTFDWLMKHPTWPTEWAPHMVFMAHADWMHTGDNAWLAPRYEALKSKLLLERAGPDGLITSTRQQIRSGDLVDWPGGERDGYVFTSVNTVVNAFHLSALMRMAELADALGRNGEAAAYRARSKATLAAFQEKLFDPRRRIYVDGEGTDHASLHANLFPLAFGLVPDKHRKDVTNWVAGKGMACSVYGAQYLMQALCENNAADIALKLMTAPNDRSWRHMVESGTTITWEAWDQKYKPNQDWNHAWGAAPANLLPRFVLGARPLAPGWRRALIRPHSGALSQAKGKIPTPRGPITIDWHRERTFTLTLDLPPGMTARVELPALESKYGVFVNDQRIAAQLVGKRWILDEEVTGKLTVEAR